jgi:hypothetical protein
MLAIKRPKLCSVCHRSRGDERVGDLHSMALSVLPQVTTRLVSRISVNWNTGESPKKIAQGLVFIRPGASPELSDLLNWIHFETMPAFTGETLQSGCRNRPVPSFLLCESGPDGHAAKAAHVLYRLDWFRTLLTDTNELLHSFHLLILVAQITFAHGFPHQFWGRGFSAARTSVKRIPEMIVKIKLCSPHDV